MVVHVDEIKRERWYIVYTSHGYATITEKQTADEAAAFVEELINDLCLPAEEVFVIYGQDKPFRNAIDKYRVEWR